MNRPRDVRKLYYGRLQFILEAAVQEQVIDAVRFGGIHSHGLTPFVISLYRDDGEWICNRMNRNYPDPHAPRQIVVDEEPKMEAPTGSKIFYLRMETITTSAQRAIEMFRRVQIGILMDIHDVPSAWGLYDYRGRLIDSYSTSSPNTFMPSRITVEEHD